MEEGGENKIHEFKAMEKFGIRKATRQAIKSFPS
jgi:hypothetical protein